MPINYSLPLSDIIPISVVVSPAAVPGPTFNQALIVGSSGVIPTYPVTSTSRLRLYTSVSAMLQDGFSTSDPEYNSATLYFGQTPAPTYLWVGAQNLTAIQTATVGAVGGTLYSVGDILTVVQGGASGGQVKVTTVGTLVAATTTGTASSGSTALTVASGTGILIGQAVTGTGIAPNTIVAGVTGTAVTLSLQTTAPLSTTAVTFTDTGVVTALAVVPGQQGTAYSVANNLMTTGGTGSGAEVDITVIAETPLQAIAACRSAQPAWYACMYVGTAVDADYEAIAEFIEAATPASLFFLTSGEVGILNGAAGNLFAVLQAENYRRTFMVYSTTQGGTYPNNVYASAAAMGRAMGLNTGSAGSYFTLCFKTLVGVGPELLSQTQVNAISGTNNRSQAGLNGNVVVTYANGAYTFLQSGTMAGGAFFDQVMFLDMLASDCQYSGVNLLADSPAIPITNAGVVQFTNVFAGACSRSQALGFIAPAGVWQGVSIGSGANGIVPGEALPNGFYVYAPSVTTLSAQAKAARQMPPFTVLLIESEAAQSLSVTIEVQQ